MTERGRWRRAACALALFVSGAGGAPGPDAKRVRALEESFRCVVCQNQTLADSQAPLAADLRAQIRAEVDRGASDDEIRAWMASRYGDFVLYRPPLEPATWVLWFGPFAALAAGIALLARLARRRPENEGGRP